MDMTITEDMKAAVEALDKEMKAAEEAIQGSATVHVKADHAERLS